MDERISNSLLASRRASDEVREVYEDTFPDLMRMMNEKKRNSTPSLDKDIRLTTRRPLMEMVKEKTKWRPED